MTKRIVFWYSVPDPYMIDRFNALAQRHSMNFECWFSGQIATERSWILDYTAMNFPHRFLRHIPAGKRHIGVPLAEWISSPADLMISFHGIPDVALSVVQKAIPRRKLVYYVEKTFEEWRGYSPLRERAKHALLSNADAILSPGADADGYVRKYSQVPIYRLQHSIKSSHFRAAALLRQTSGSADLKRSLNLNNTVFINVGRMWDKKGIANLISAYATVERSEQSTSLLLVGDGPDKRKYESLVRELNLSSVQFMDFVQQSNLPEIYALADVFVFPTLGDPYGLVVDEAMASGLPIIATTSAGEISSRVIPGITGLLVAPDSVESLQGAMMAVLSQSTLVSQMGQNAEHKFLDVSVERWVDQITTAVTAILS